MPLFRLRRRVTWHMRDAENNVVDTVDYPAGTTFVEATQVTLDYGITYRRFCPLRDPEKYAILRRIDQVLTPID